MPIISRAHAWGMMWKSLREFHEAEAAKSGVPVTPEFARLCDQMALSAEGAVPEDICEQKIAEAAMRSGVSPDEFRRAAVDDLFGMKDMA